MQSKAFILFALSAAVSASPFHKRQELGHHRHHHGTGTEGIIPTGTGALPRVNDTNGFFTPSESASIMPVSSALTMTVSPLPEKAASAPTNFGNAATGVDASSSCVSTSLATEFSTNFVTVTASGADTAETKVADISAGAFYGGQSKSYGGGWGQSSSAAVVPVPSASGIAPSASASSPSTTFATATKSGVGASGTASASASASAAPPSSGSGGGKRGISFNDASLVSAFGNSVSWAYNWAATESGNLGGVEYVPMMWGKDNVDSFASTVGSATHVLSFNEPDLGEQANIDPQTAATLHKQGMQDLVGKVQIGSPAVTNGNSDSPPMGVKWLTQFFTACGKDCPVDFVNMHWYAGAENFDYFKQCVDDVVTVAQNNGISKVWVTEFAPSGSADAQASFMKQAVAYLDGNAAVERYAAFMASDGTLLSGKSLNSVGSAYAG